MKYPLKRPDYIADVFLVDRDVIPTVWPEVEPHLSRAMSHSLGELSLEDLREIVDNGAGALLAFIDTHTGEIIGGAVTQILNHQDGRRVCRILAYGADDWNATAHCLEDVENSARSVGAQAMHFNGRPGWVKLCEPMGYKPMQVIMEKAL
jgi:hypothetical protein